MAKPDPVAAALRMAEEEAKNLAASTETQTQTHVPSTTTGTGGAVAAAPVGQRRSLADLAASAAMSVDFYFGVDDLGIKIGKDKSRRDSVDVELKFRDIKGGWIIRGNTPNGVKYHTTYDGALEAKSRQPWETIVARVQQADGNAYISDLIELPVTLLNDIDDFKDKTIKPIKAGTRGGVSISYMNYREFCGWFAEMLGEHGEDKVLKVRIGHKPKTGGGNSDYGVYTWELIED
jgi:hypothetical protein